MKTATANYLRSPWREEDERWSEIGALCWMAFSGLRKSQKDQKMEEGWKYFVSLEKLLKVWEDVTLRPGVASQAAYEASQAELQNKMLAGELPEELLEKEVLRAIREMLNLE